jgi:aspartyl-tRNA(Asn)/glutamyl-tRNA(Gln) amidotransferase subunit B
MWSDKLQIVGVPGIEAAIDKYGLRQISDSGAIEKIVDEVLAKSAAQIADFKSGKEKALMSIVGMVMKASAGKANPAQVNDIVRRKIAAL